MFVDFGEKEFGLDYNNKPHILFTLQTKVYTVYIEKVGSHNNDII